MAGRKASRGDSPDTPTDFAGACAGDKRHEGDMNSEDGEWRKGVASESIQLSKQARERALNMDHRTIEQQANHSSSKRTSMQKIILTAIPTPQRSNTPVTAPPKPAPASNINMPENTSKAILETLNRWTMPPPGAVNARYLDGKETTIFCERFDEILEDLL